MNRVTMADVAREAGVSLMTVSRVINDKGDVSDDTRQRVLAVVERLDYRPSGIARSLATRRTGTIGLLVPDISNPFFADVARGVADEAYEEEYSVFLCSSDEEPARELEFVASLEEKRVDGLIACSSRLSSGQLVSVLGRHSNVVLINRRSADSHASTVLADDEAGACMIVEHLVRAGHRTIAYLAGPAASYSGTARLAGYRSVLELSGIAFHPDLVRQCAPTADGGAAAAEALLALRPDITALFCYNDLVAVGALRACADQQLAVPDRIAVTGFDDIAIAGLVVPPLTTCRVPRYEIGVQATKALLTQINGEPCNGCEMVLPVELVVRASAP
ncbi:MAG: LacI family DNA-binding transcriptional regulator [Caldilineales bacterium]